MTAVGALRTGSRTAAVLVVLTAVASLLSCTGSSTPRSTTPPSTAAPATVAPPTSPTVGAGVHWVACTEPFLRRARAQCGSVRVPLDYAHPSGRHITLAVSRVRHDPSAGRYLGVMLINPGGPGAPGIDFAVEGSRVPGRVGRRYDWIGFDTRGVGASRPRVSCDDTITAFDRPDYRATTPALQRYWLNRSRSYARDCGTKNAELLPHLTTEDSARDLDRIRVALGVGKISYYGFSDGTYLGMIYATLFPQRIDRMVLDSTVDPRGVWYPAQLAQDVAFEVTARRFFGWVAHYHKAFALGSTETAVEGRFDSELDALARHPAQGKIGPDELTDIATLAAYYQSYWPFVAHAWADLVHHDSIAPLVALGLGPADDNEYAIYNAVGCTDARWPRSYATWRADAIATNRRAPFMTWLNVWYNAPCLYWPVPAGVPVTPRLGGVPPTLLVDETLDAATPYEGSLYVRSIFPASRLLAIPNGVSHGSSLEGNPCEDTVIADYLARGTLPARHRGSHADVTCPAGRAPGPSAGS